MDVIARGGHIDRARLTPDATLESLGIASVDIVEILMLLEEEFNVYISVDESLSKVANVQELVSAIEKQINEKKAS